MRLINTETLGIQDFTQDVDSHGFPSYAILSHRWREGEISYKDFTKGRGERSFGYWKIRKCCQFARSRKLHWLWADTCCIDKRSSSELSEAINSMFKYYLHATQCYVYLDDVFSDHRRTTALEGIRQCSWVTRGWTLQELIAPSFVIFLASDWTILGDSELWSWTLRDDDELAEYRGTEDTSWEIRSAVLSASRGRQHLWPSEKLLEALVSATSIPREVLSHDLLSERLEALGQQSVATRMSWMAGRQTTRIEDQAYCVLGIFNINMPLLYGEGSKAFARLQAEILRESSDESIFAWDTSASTKRRLLAASPADFPAQTRIRRTLHYQRVPYAITNQGLRLDVSMYPGRGVHKLSFQGFDGVLVLLNCVSGRVDEAALCVLFLQRMPCGHYVRQHVDLSTLRVLLSNPELESICHRPPSSLRPESPRVMTSRHDRMTMYIHLGEQHHTACNLDLTDVEGKDLMQDISDREYDSDLDHERRARTAQASRNSGRKDVPSAGFEGRNLQSRRGARGRE